MEIIFFKASNGSQPARDFLNSLDSKMRAKLVDQIKYLQEVGHLIRPPRSEHLQGEIYELRAQSNGNISRILYFFVIGNKAVLTHGFIKKTQKTPQREIDRAEEYRKQYLAQQREGLNNYGRP